MAKLTAPQRALLELASKKMEINYYDACRVDARGPTLAAAVRAGWMVKTSYPDGSNAWSITPDGRTALADVEGKA